MVELEKPYCKVVDPEHPACVLIMVDQSLSMNCMFGRNTSESKAIGVADCVNNVLHELLKLCRKGDQIRDLFRIGAIGYGEKVGSVLGDGSKILWTMNELDNLKIESTTSRVLPDGRVLELDVPVWLSPTAGNSTPMKEAFALARDTVAEFLRDCSDCFPPIVVNITDGAPKDGNPREEVEQLKKYSSTNGNVLVLTVHVSSSTLSPVAFPEVEALLREQEAKEMFRITSTLPDVLIEKIKERTAYRPQPGARAFIYNGDPSDVSAMLDLATRH